MQTRPIGGSTGGIGTAMLSATLQGLPSSGGSILLPLDQLLNEHSPIEIRTTSLAAGANTINFPSTAGGVIVVMPASSTVAITLKGVSGDTGIGILATGWFILTRAASQTSFVLNAASAVDVTVIFF